MLVTCEEYRELLSPLGQVFEIELGEVDLKVCSGDGRRSLPGTPGSPVPPEGGEGRVVANGGSAARP